MSKLAQTVLVRPLGLIAVIGALAIIAGGCSPQSHADHVSIVRDGKPEAVSSSPGPAR